MTPPKSNNRYKQLIEKIFFSHYRANVTKFDFRREEIAEKAQELKITLPKNLGDIIYSFRYRADLPESIQKKAPKGKQWIIRAAGRAKYRFVAVTVALIQPSPLLAFTKVPDSTPGVIAMYAQTDEQALLAKVRYNRLIDIFTGVTCYSLQSHLRTTAPGMGQVETDELYIGVDRKGAHYVFPVQAKGKKDQLSVVQIEQDLAVCVHKYPNLICRPIGAQFSQDKIVLFEFESGDAGVALISERHYKLVPPEQVTIEDLRAYRIRESSDL